MNRTKVARDKNIPEGTVMDLRSARHRPPLSEETKVKGPISEGLTLCGMKE